MSFESENLSGKIILEVGSGRGDTTRKLVNCLTGQSGSQLIVTDISDRLFPSLQAEFHPTDVNIRYIQTAAQELRGIDDSSVDFIVCNYTLCAVNSQAGLAALALQRFNKVMKPGGKLFVEEEYPPQTQNTFMYKIWAEKWRILRSSMILAGQATFNEIAPEIMENLCYLAGFTKVTWTAHTERYPGDDVLNFFHKRLNSLLKELPNEKLCAGFEEMAQYLEDKAVQAGGMEVPFYRLTAQKGAG